jgi:hypothetical protein
MSDNEIQVAQLLADVHTAIQKYCVLPGAGAYTAVALWCAYTHLTDAFHYAPRLSPVSPSLS